MSFEKLMELGAESVGGFVYLDRVHLGNSSPVGFVLTPAGEELLSKAAAAPAKKVAAPKKAKKPDPEAPAMQDHEAGGELNIDDILGDVAE